MSESHTGIKELVGHTSEENRESTADEKKS